MAEFDWQAFLDRHGIVYKTTRGNLYTHCPFCGAADHGQKMGISTQGRGWGCWRQQTHRGKAPERLIQALLGCSWAEAVRLAGGGSKRLAQGQAGFAAMVEEVLGVSPPAALPAPLAKPREFHPLGAATPKPFRQYLGDRGFTRDDMVWLGHRFGLHWAMDGAWAYRIIIPIPDQKGQWQTWTGRAINADARVRYKTLSVDPGKLAPGEQPARGPITNYLLDLDRLFRGGDYLLLAEGPFDAMRLAMFSQRFGMRATCLFGKAVTNAQIDLLIELRPLYRDIILLLDPDAALDALALQTRLAPLGVLSHLLEGEDDPGEMKPLAIRRLMSRLREPGRLARVHAAARGDF